MRVLIIETTVFGYDGITSVITNYYKYQDHKRVHMDFVTKNPVSDTFKKELDKYGGKNYILPYRNQYPLKYIIQLINVIRSGGYQIVHVHGCSATMAVEMLAAWLAGVKVRISHSHNTKCDHEKADKFLRPIFNVCCNVGFACGKEAGEWLFPGRNFYVVSNGIDLAKYQYNEDVRKQMRSKYGLDGSFVIGHVGRFSKQKNHDKLIDIFEAVSKHYNNAKLVLIGDGELKDKIENRTQKSGLDVLFVGNSSEVEKWLQAMDMIVFPSLYEGLPLGLVEAQAAGLPCILSNTISPDTEITDLVDFVSLDASADKWVDEINKNKERFNRRERVETVKQQICRAHFDIRSNCVDLARKYEELLTNKRK